MLDVENAAEECRLSFGWYRSVIRDVVALRAEMTRAAGSGDEPEAARLRERLEHAERARRLALLQYDQALDGLHGALVRYGRIGDDLPSAVVR